MAAETHDWRAARALIDEAKVRECCTAHPSAPAWMREPDAVPYLCLGLPAEPSPDTPFRVFASGWDGLEGVMVQMLEPDFPADLRASVVARGERALRDLLLAFPRGVTGLFYYSAPWALDVLTELFDGQPLPPREGYYATADTLAPVRTRPTRRLGRDDYPVMRRHWSPEVWADCIADDYVVFVAPAADDLGAFCFHWPVAPGRREVHGLQGVRDWSAGHAESVFSAATEDVLARGEVATCTANLGGTPEAEVPLRVGYRRFYRVRQFLGVKKGSGAFEAVDPEAFFRGAPRSSTTRRSVRRPPSEPELATIRALREREGRRRHELFAAEGLVLARRAIDDGLAVECLIYTRQLERMPEGAAVLEAAWRAGVPHHRVSDAVMGTLTGSRPLPAAMAIVHARLAPAERLPLHGRSVVLVAEKVDNPSNLGMIIRTADAMGVDAVVVAGGDPLNSKSIRAARGAVGRLPIHVSGALPVWLHRVRADGLSVLGATPGGSAPAYAFPLRAPLALLVGNEHDGLSAATLAACTERVRIPMAPGQDSLNVGVAAGMLLYEVVRQREAAG